MKKFLKKKNVSVKSIHDLKDSQKFMIKNKWSMFASRDVFTLVRKRGVICVVTPILIIPLQGVY